MKKMLICTPSHDAKVVIPYVQGILDVQQNLKKKRKGRGEVYVDYFWQENGSDIVKGRESMFWFWYHETDHDYMLFMDADQGFSAQDISNLLETMEKHQDKAIVCAPVPLKEVKPDRMIEYIVEAISDATAPFTREGLFPVTYDYNFSGDHEIVAAPDGVIQVERCGTGAMLISRKAIKIAHAFMEESSGEFTGSETYTSRATKDKVCYTIFTHLLMGGKLLGEDYSFCVRMSLADIPVLVDLRCNLSHHGSMVYEGNFKAKMEFQNHMQKATNNTL